MDKKIVKLNEEQLQKIVTESVKKILAEGNFNEEDMNEGPLDFLAYGAKRIGRGVKDAVDKGREKIQQGIDKAHEYSQARDNERRATKNVGKVQKYINTLNDMYNSGLFNGVSYGKRAMQEIQDLIKTLNRVSGAYNGNATAWNNDANNTLQPQA